MFYEKIRRKFYIRFINLHLDAEQFNVFGFTGVFLNLNTLEFSSDLIKSTGIERS